MTDLEINKALTKLAGDCWHELVTLVHGKRTYEECVHCYKTGSLALLESNIEYTESLDTTYELAGKLGYAVRIYDGYCLQAHVTVALRKTVGLDKMPVVGLAQINITETINRQRACRLALCKALLKAEGKWEDS